MRELFGLPLDLTYFIGQGPTFGSGEVFTEFFGAAPIGSSYTGFVHFPDAPTKARGTYDGLFTPTGTGLQIDLSPMRDRWLLSVLLYQDSLIEPLPWPAFGEGHYSLDVRYRMRERGPLRGLRFAVGRAGWDDFFSSTHLLLFAQAVRAQCLAHAAQVQCIGHVHGPRLSAARAGALPQ